MTNINPLTQYLEETNPITRALGAKGHARLLREAADRIDPPELTPEERIAEHRGSGFTSGHRAIVAGVLADAEFLAGVRLVDRLSLADSIVDALGAR